MNMLTSKKTELLNNHQRYMIEDALKNKVDFDLINVNDNDTLEFQYYCSVNDLYDYLSKNIDELNIKALAKLNDNYTVNIVNILLDLIQKENDLNWIYKRVFLDINDLLKKYDDYSIQYFYENYLKQEYKYYSTRSLNGFYLTVKKEKAFIFSDNKLLIDAVKYVVDNDLNLYEWLGVEIE